MLSNNTAISNEIPGSFWRPDSYMEKVPATHILGYTPEASLNISDIGREMAQKFHSISSNYIDNKAKTFNKDNGQFIDISL